MNAYSQIEDWITQTALAVDSMNSPDADGFWRLPYGRVTLSLGVSEQSDSFILYAPLMSVAGAGSDTLSEFYQYLLHLQLRGALPSGMAFGMDLDDTLVGVVGQYPMADLDLPSFDSILRNAASAADALCEQLQSRFTAMLDADAPAEGPAEPLAAPQLSDEELLRARMMQSMHF